MDVRIIKYPQFYRLEIIVNFQKRYFETFYIVNEMQPEKRIEFDLQVSKATNKEELGTYQFL